MTDQWFTWALSVTDVQGGGAAPWENLAWAWFQHAEDGPANYRQVLGASSALLGTMYGVTTSHQYKCSWLFRDAIEEKGSEQDPPATDVELAHFTGDTTVHELAHQFGVLACSEGHHNDQVNPKPAWCSAPWSDPSVCPNDASSPELCLMNNGDILGAYSQGWDSVAEFCEECLFLGDPACSGSPRPGALRTAEDPPF